MFMEKGCLVDSAEKIKKALNVPVMTVGRINDPVLADEIIEKGKADLVCMGRGLLADPEMPRKAKEGRLDEIRTCIACNTCMESIFRRGRVECLVNPALGREKEMAFYPAQKRKKLMVIGGGPGGLNVAWVAAKRGHEVHLFERNSELGGQLIVGSITGYKKEIRNLIRFQINQIKKFGVICHLGIEVTPEIIKETNPDAVILATGSLPYFPPVEGIESKIVVPFTEVLNGGAPVGKRTVVIGGGATGCEVALHLSEQGCPVTIVDMLPRIGDRLESMTRKILMGKLKEHGVRFMTEFKLKQVREDGVILEGKDGSEVFAEAERVVVTIGNRPDNSLFERIKPLGYEIHQIGDCLEPRNAKAAIYEGGVLGRTI